MKDIIIRLFKKISLLILVAVTIVTGALILLKNTEVLTKSLDNISSLKIVFICSISILLFVWGKRICRYLYVLRGRAVVIVRDDKYPVSLKSFFKITRLQMILFAKRSVRRLAFIVKNIKNTLLLLPVWLAFITILWLVTNDGFFELINQAKFSIFTSIILVCVSALRRAISSYKQDLFDQHAMYCELMHEAESLTGIVIRKINGVNEEDFEIQSYFYTDGRFEQLCEFLKDIKKDKLVYVDSVVDNLKDIDTCVKTIYKACRGSDIYFYENIEKWFSAYKAIYSRIFEKRSLNKEDFIFLIENLYDMVSFLRSIWRRDLDIDTEIAWALYNECDDKDDLDYYLRLLIDDDFKNEYPVATKKIIKVKIRNNVRRG